MTLSLRSIGLWGALAASLILTGCGSPEQRARDYYDRGKEFITKGDDLNARVQLMTSIKFKSDNVEVWRALAGVEERLRSLPAMFGDLRRIVELDPNDIDARMKLARMMAISGANDAALKVLDAANEGERPNAALHALRAFILGRTKDVAGAVREAQRAVEIEPGNVDATLLLASNKTTAGDADGALKLLNSLRPTNAQDTSRIALQKVQVFVRNKDIPQAEALLKQLIADNPGSAKALRSELTRVYLSEKDFDGAEKELRVAADASPSDHKAVMDLVRFLISTKGGKVGRDELVSRIKAGGDVYDYQIALAELDFSEGRVTEATQQLQSLASGDTNADHKLGAQTRLADMYVKTRNYVAAEPLIAEILKTDRRNTTGLQLRAAIRIEQKQYDSAIADLREALNNQPKSTDLLLLMALAYERSGKNELADRQYAEALKASRQNPNVASRYVGFLQRRGDLSHAEDVLSEVIDQNPNDLQSMITLAAIRLDRRNWAGALTLAEAIGKFGNKAAADEIRASAFAGQNKIDESISAFESAHAAAPDAVRPIVSLVSDYLRSGKTDKADALVQEMLKKYPENAMLLVLEAQTRLAQNRIDDAIQDLRSAIAKQPNDPAAYNALANLYANQKKYDAALDVIQQAMRAIPSNSAFALASASLEIQKGDLNAAIAQYETLLKEQPTVTVAINNLVSLILDNRSDKESLDRAFGLAEGLKNSPVPQFQDTYGWAQYKRGDYPSSISVLEAAQAKMSNSAPLHYHLGMSYAAGGQPQKAAEQFKLALSLEPDGTDLKARIRAAIKPN